MSLPTITVFVVLNDAFNYLCLDFPAVTSGSPNDTKEIQTIILMTGHEHLGIWTLQVSNTKIHQYTFRKTRVDLDRHHINYVSLQVRLQKRSLEEAIRHINNIHSTNYS